MNVVERAARAAWRPKDRRTVWEWCEEHVVVDNSSPMPGKWRSSNSPWVKELMEDFEDNRVRDISVMCSAQSAKTQTIMNCLCWAIAEDPGPAMWVMASQEEAEQFVRNRLADSLTSCKPVADALLDKLHAIRKAEVNFSTMTLYITGAGSPSKLQSKPIRWLLLDEVRNYPKGALHTVLKRTRAFWNARRLIISTPAASGDEVHRAFLSGNQKTWHVRCPHCGHLQQLKFSQLKWEKNDVTKPNGKWNFDALAETIRWQCEACETRFTDNPATRKQFCREGKFVAMNPHAPVHLRSYHWNALLPHWVPWRSIVEEFLLAQDALRGGDIEPMRTFVNETLGEPWEDRMGEIDDYDFLEYRKADYGFNEPWAEERIRFMAADRQERGGEHYWYVVRAFGPYGKSRLITYGKCSTLEQLEEIRIEHNVPVINAVIDTGFKASELYRFCASTGWKAFKGDDCQYFPHQDKKSKKTVRRIWNKTTVDPSFGTSHTRKLIPLFRWSNPMAKDLLAEMMQGLVGEWTIPRLVGNEYLKQLTAETRKERIDAKGHVHYEWHRIRRDNHLLDCELMILVAAVITKNANADRETVE